MPGDVQLTEQALDALRQKYFVRLRERMDRLDGLFAQSRGREFTPDERNLLRTEAHSLVGSGKTYGFPDITEVAGKLENAILSGVERAGLEILSKSLINACKSVIPEKTLNQPHANPATEADTAQPLQRTVAQEKKILLIDDDPAIQDLIAKLFENDATVLIENDGRAGLETLRAQNPTLTLLDISMPGMGGLSLLETIEHDEYLKQSPIMMLSAHHEQSYVAKAMLSWALGYVVKPFDIKAFSARVRNLLERLETTILIADDDEAILDMMMHKFRVAGVRTILARDGNEAQELIVTQRPKLAIIDWMMPGLDGTALLRHVKNMSDAVRPRIIMLTARHQEQDILDALKLGAEDYITKPFFPDEVVMRSLRMLGLKDMDAA